MNIKWHKLELGDKVRFKINKGDSAVICRVLSFRKLNAIVLCDTGVYELLAPAEFNGYYLAEKI